MSERISPELSLPSRRLMILGSVAIIGHLSAIVIVALAVRSGPWASPYGESLAEPPHFAELPNRTLSSAYLLPLRLTYHYHFGTNYPAPLGVFFEVKLRDAKGGLVKTLKFPDSEANFLARHRQELLARALASDVPLPPPGPETVAAPGQDLRTIPMWDRVEETKPSPLKLVEVRPHETRRNWPVYRASDWSLLVAKSYARYLCRETGAASAEIIRHSEVPVPPMVLIPQVQVPEGMFGTDVVASFGELPR